MCVRACDHPLTRLGVAEDWGAAAEGGAAAIVTAAATAAAHAATPGAHHHLDLLGGTHCREIRLSH